ncbi:ABC transporter ATP-binding protein [Limibacillus halophilus]|uniref:Branched-chain amino acid transport system ATP-binding protein n=1 Tax=Limibacillus halophilus TaxID=1579333 RepID=A0A839SST3_9PROT|nr:ABC transporter ATP-binding protein [Limibacillus halophilus]MBB3064386.1 branched-chain amino acid transport system ATP-binding protein [Limibacillus halophilus]
MTDGIERASTGFSIEGLEAFYGAAQILFGVDLTLAPGELVALVGRNGAGKSTILKAVVGLGARACGSIRYGGTELLGMPTHKIASLGVGYVPEERRVFAELTVAENLLAGARTSQSGSQRWTFDSVLELFPALSKLLDRRAGLLSGGEQQMLTVARTLMGNPTLLLLDEPSEGLAPLIVRQMSDAIAELKREGIAILLSEQNLQFARRLCDRAYILEKGRILATGDLGSLLDDKHVSRALMV